MNDSRSQWIRFLIYLFLCGIVTSCTIYLGSAPDAKLGKLANEAENLVGKSPQDIQKTWGKPTLWSSFSIPGQMKQETWVYHFLKPGKQQILDKYVQTGSTASGQLTMSATPYAQELLDNYWIFNVYIREGIVINVEQVTKARGGH